MTVPPAGSALRLRGRVFGPGRPVVMGIVNRTTDSFYASDTTDDVAMATVDRHAEAGADLVDIGGVRAGRGAQVGVQEEIDRVTPLVRWVRDNHPELLVSVDTWRAPVAEAVAAAGADLLNDTWAGHDPRLVEVAAAHGLGVVCSHTGGAVPRTDPFRVAYPAPADAEDPAGGLLRDVVDTLVAGARRAVGLGVDPASVLVDPTHDFGKNTWHSLHLLRSTETLAGLGFPLLVALSRKDFVGESLGLPADQRLEGTLAATALAAWSGAKVFRTHDVAATRRCVDMIAVIRGDLSPARAVRGLA